MGDLSRFIRPGVPRPKQLTEQLLIQAHRDLQEAFRLQNELDDHGIYIPPKPIPGIARAHRIQRWWKFKREVRAHWTGLVWWSRIHREMLAEIGIAAFIVAVLVLGWMR